MANKDYQKNIRYSARDFTSANLKIFGILIWNHCKISKLRWTDV